MVMTVFVLLIRNLNVIVNKTLQCRSKAISEIMISPTVKSLEPATLPDILVFSQMCKVK